MKSSVPRPKRPSILYISYAVTPSQPAPDVNSVRRIKALRSAGARILHFRHVPGHFLTDCTRILKIRSSYDIIMIRIDGSGMLDKFTLLKIFRPEWKIIWELHGFPSENYTSHPTASERIIRHRRYIQRLLLSRLTHSIICVSRQLEAYAKTVLGEMRYSVIPNFVIPDEYRIPKIRNGTAFDYLAGNFLVLWGGSASLPWQAIDTIERVAKLVYTKDQGVLFVISGSDAWHPISWRKNILELVHLPRNEFLKLVHRANVCLALYHTPKYIPFYFAPLKVLDFMALGKPVIASDEQTIRSVITDGFNGLLTNGSPPDIAEKILRLKRDATYADAMGKRARKRVMDAHAIRTARQQYGELLKSCI